MEGDDFILQIETSLSHDVLSLGQMYNLSLWLARFIAEICHVNTCVLTDSD